MYFPISDLPINILEEIFCKLPITTLIRCRYVCKSWKNIIANPNFSKLHQKFNDVLICVQGLLKWPEFLFERDIYWLQFQGKSSYGDLETEFEFPNLHPSFQGKFINSCNGLVCLLLHPFNGYSNAFMHISNPVTGEHMYLPALKKDNVCDSHICGLGFSPKTKQFKAIRITYEQKDYVGGNSQALAEVCTLGTGSWRNVGFSPRYDYASYQSRNLYNKNVFLNESIHWLVKRIDALSGNHEICAFNFDTEQFVTFRVPHQAEDYKVWSLDIHNFGDSLCMYFGTKNLMQVWVMKEYGAAESWAKILSFDAYMVPVLKFLKNGDILLVEPSYLSLYNPEREIFTKLKTRGPKIETTSENTTFLVHNPSFVSLKDMVAGDNSKA